MKIFSGRANPELAKRISNYMGISLGGISITNFPDGEIWCKIEEDVRGRDIFIIQPTCKSVKKALPTNGDESNGVEPTINEELCVNESLMELLIMIDSVKRASAERITAVIPYFGYARQDRKDEGRVPITAKLAANLIVRAGADRVLTMDLHAAQIQGFFDIPVDHLYAAPVISSHFLRLGLTGDDIAVVSPDEGSIKRALGFHTKLGGNLAIIDKRRLGAEQTSAQNIIGGPVEGKTALIFDDMISTAGSICGAAEMVHAAGAEAIYLAATHGVLCGPAFERIAGCPAKKVILTDTVPLPADAPADKIEVLSVAPLLGEAIKRIHRNESVSRLFGYYAGHHGEGG